jgi:hypothetical protein
MMRKMTDGILIQSGLVKFSNVVQIQTGSVEGFTSKHFLITYSKKKKEFKIVGVDNLEGKYLVDLIVFTDKDPSRFMIDVSVKIFPKKSEDEDPAVWISGICSASTEEKNRLHLKDDACIWEGLIKIPSSTSIDAIKKSIHDIDNNFHILREVIVKKIELTD